MNSSAQKNRIPLSLRLPPGDLSIINSYATAQHVSKTDAFLYFLRKGIDADKMRDPQLLELEEKLDSILKLLERTPATITTKSISETVSSIASAYPAILRVFLFGSFARGDATLSSDVDLRLELNEEEPFSLFDLSRFKKDFELIIGRDSDIITVKSLANQQLEKAFEKEKVLIYERKKK